MPDDPEVGDQEAPPVPGVPLVEGGEGHEMEQYLGVLDALQPVHQHLPRPHLHLPAGGQGVEEGGQGEGQVQGAVGTHAIWMSNLTSLCSQMESTADMVVGGGRESRWEPYMH